MRLVLDATVLGKLCHPRKHTDVAAWLMGLIRKPGVDLRIFVPEIADYELRRKLLHLVAKKKATSESIERLDALGAELDYAPLTTPQFRDAAQLWAVAREKGYPTAPDASLDPDVLLAAQARALGAAVVTSNRKHLTVYGIEAKDWNEF